MNTKIEEDTSTESDDSQYSYSDEQIVQMPPLKYARIVGCLPRSQTSNSNADAAGGSSTNRGSHPIETEITCSALGRITLRPDPSNPTQEIDACTQTSHSILAVGHVDGSIRIVDANSGESLLFGSTLQDGGVWYVNPKQSGKAIVALSFDSSCSHLAAIDVSADAVVFGPLVWGRRDNAPPKRSNAARNIRAMPSYGMAKPPMATIRFSYSEQPPVAWGLSHATEATQQQRPTCTMLDPSYARPKKERSLLLGFRDGRLVLSKLQVSTVSSGLSSRFFGGSAAASSTVKKVDTVLYQAVLNARGIESLAWRGGMIAWADESGVRIFDIETMSRIAHIDRPTGARANLYPTISDLHPCILFERSDSLLIGWGDCLMGMQIRDSASPYKTTNEGGSGGGKEAKRKVVECGMAWELDCVACGVMPLDGKHVAVLGLVPCPSDLDDDGDSRDANYFGSLPGSVAGGDNILELQIINREDGKSISNDRIPLMEKFDGTFNKSPVRKPNVADFSLLSSYGIQRMEDLAEWDALNDGDKETIRNQVDMSEFMSKQTFPDAHLRWSMDKDVCTIKLSPNEEGVMKAEESDEDGDGNDEQSSASNCSVLSDDYVFALSEPIQDILADPTVLSRSHPPTMVIMYKYDACLVQTRDADDAVSYARSLGKPALALKVALAHRRDVRRHGIDLLIDEYFVALLRMQEGSTAAISFSRLQIAAQSMPILLGGDARMWQRWIFLFARVSGALFTIREKIPVRDPWLPPFVFEMVLETMLHETCSNNASKPIQNESERSQQGVGGKMADLFLETLRAWGPTSSLRRRIQMHRYFDQNHQLVVKRSTLSSDAIATFIHQAEKDLQRRISQTAFGVLTDSPTPNLESKHISIRQHISSSDDSLYSVENMLLKFSKLFSSSDEHAVDPDFVSSSVLLGKVNQVAAIVVETVAELELMRERYDRAIGYYLAIGSSYVGESALSAAEALAVETVNKYHRSRSTSLSSSIPRETYAHHLHYEHVLSLIELHQLHHFLLQRNYFFVGDDGSDACPPIVSLIKLVGLERAGMFLLESCSPPEDNTTGEASGIRPHLASLPLDLVSDQLKSSPKLLYWYLFLLFTQKPEMYVKFPTTAVPPVVITDLHRMQFYLFVDYANLKSSDEADTAPSFLDVDEETSFMSFLKAALPHAGIRPECVIEALESHRGGKIDSPVFARELAFVTEKFGSGSYDDVKKVLQLYLLGAKNLFLAVAYAERNSKQSAELWELLISHCTEDEGHGALFGSLLEAAAHCGADLSSLVSKIPEGVAIEGLRPKLLAAVTDYRHKVKIHECESNIQTDDKISIIRELSHLSRRGSRKSSDVIRCKKEEFAAENTQNSTAKKSLLQVQRERARMLSIPAHMSNSLSLAIR